ncbi:steroid receptor RNA activator 1 isoform X3 [Channa argus]|uniref:steroid receptor RNA activator 1 isoform X3 n=1 Tax=Channa argus TaxID=215402 RepID=UPI003523021F
MESNMEDKYIKPGNQERGWNDPPQFSYNFQMARGPQRNLLNKRAVAPGRPPAGSMVTLTPPVGPLGSQKKANSSQSQSEPDVEGVVSVLDRALAACRQTVKDQVCNDVAKRLHLLEDSWRKGKLSLPVRRRMDTLAQELQLGHWDSADDIHRSLMVDHVTEVSQWMVGVKRLIAETRGLSPELLEPLQNPAESVQNND